MVVLIYILLGTLLLGMCLFLLVLMSMTEDDIEKFFFGGDFDDDVY